MPPKKKPSQREVAEEFKPKWPNAPRQAEGYTHIRNGLWEHTAQALMSPLDFCAYTTIHRFAKFSTGICVTNANSLSCAWGDAIKPAAIRQCMNRLREAGYINYPYGTGTRGSYPVAIDKYEPAGDLIGWRLNAQCTYDLNDPVYEYVSSTPMAVAYGEAAVIYLDDSMKKIREWVESFLKNSDTRNPVVGKPNHHEFIEDTCDGMDIVSRSEAGCKQVVRRSKAGRTQVLVWSEAGGKQLVGGSEALYTMSLIHSVTAALFSQSIGQHGKVSGGGATYFQRTGDEAEIELLDEPQLSEETISTNCRQASRISVNIQDEITNPPCRRCGTSHNLYDGALCDRVTPSRK
jgi:hypothetical protein